MFDLKAKEAEMALVKCPECGSEVSTKAENCQHCGAPVPVPESLGYRILYIGSGIFLGLIFLFMILTFNSQDWQNFLYQLFHQKHFLFWSWE
jgi:endogenous inhibitor of DNA gyrase (YacG/DUF329 family)